MAGLNPDRSTDRSPASPQFDEFLRLEASGWKGRQQTALMSRPEDAVYFKEIAIAAERRKQLSMRALRLDGVPIAMKCDFHTGGIGFTFKIAFDERMKAFSPGVLLEIDNLHRFYESDLQLLDSCAEGNHFMFNTLWLERRTLQSLLVPNTTVGEIIASGMPLLQIAGKTFRKRRQDSDSQKEQM